MNFLQRLFRRKNQDNNTDGETSNYEEFYGYNDDEISIKVELLEQDALSYNIKVSLMNRIEPNRSFRFAGVVENVDPDGFASFSELDPEGVGNATEFYQAKTEEFVLNLYRPYDEANAVTISIRFNSPNPGNLTEFERTLQRHQPENKKS